MFVDFKMVLLRPIFPQLICLLLTILLVLEIATGVHSFFSLEKAMSVRHDQPMETTSGVKKDSMNTALKTTLFGEYVPQSIVDADVKKSILRVKVVGIMFANTESLSHVIIRSAGGREQTFGVGDSLPGGGVIKRITSDGVLIWRDGSLESLSLPKSALTFEAPSRPLGSSNEE